MPKQFNVPSFYRSPGIGRIKRLRAERDPKRHDTQPTTLDFGPVRFKLARHFGFCYGVENAIEIAYRAIRENPGKRIFLLSEMIHNPDVNADLQRRGVEFLTDTSGKRLRSFDDLTGDDIVIVPAFGTTVELQRELESHGINPYSYDSTCPFVEKVWKRSAELGRDTFSVIVHGKRTHEETRATFSHSKQKAPTLVVRDMEDTDALISFIKGETSEDSFRQRFSGAMSDGFDPQKDLQRVGVVNQTTMLASETHAIAEKIRQAMVSVHGEEKSTEHFADTKDTLCYATYENQTATQSLIESGADIAVVIGGYNSSNTSHLVELCELSMPSYYIRNAEDICSKDEIRHWDLHERATKVTSPWLPDTGDRPATIAMTTGASCPDAIVDEVITKIAAYFRPNTSLETVISNLESASSPVS